MMICTTAKSVYYPVSRQRAEVIRGSARVRYVRGSLLVNAKSFDKSIKGVNGRGPVYAAYSFIRVKDNSEDVDIMDPEELEAIRKRSKTYNPKTDTNEVPTSRDLIHTTEANEETAQ